MSSRRAFLARLTACLGGATTMPVLVKAGVITTPRGGTTPAAESAPPPLPTTAQSRFTRAFAVRLEACCRRQGKTLDDVARELGEFLCRQIHPERLIPMCCEGDEWIFVVHIVADILDVNVSWLTFGEDAAMRRRWIWRTASTKCLASPLKVLK